jgi:hypothetical protein
MKKIIITLIALMFLLPCLFASTGMNVRFGFLAPSATKTGIFPGFSYGFNIDNLIDMGLGADFFYRNERETRTISVAETPGGTEVITKQVGSDLTTYYLPLMASVRIGVPVDLPVIPYAGGSVGWGLLWENVFIAADDTEDPPIVQIDDNNFFSGFNWGLQLGTKYLLSPNAGVYGEFFYNGGKMKKDIEKGIEGITWDEINMSGVGLRLGLEVRL